MDRCRWVRVLRPFNSISVISRRWKGEHERLCAMKRRLGSGRISPPAGFEPTTPWSEVGSDNHADASCAKWEFSLCPLIPELYRTILELRKGYTCMLKIDQVCVPAQSGNSWISENSPPAGFEPTTPWSEVGSDNHADASCAKWEFSLCPLIPELYRTILELRKGYTCMLKIDQVCVPAQSGNSWISENSSNADIHLETKQKNVLCGKGSNV